MFYISCVLVIGPLILRGTGPKIGVVLQNIQHGFPVTMRLSMGDSGFNAAEDMQHDQHSGRLNGDKISLWPRILVIFHVFPTPLVHTPLHRTAPYDVALVVHHLRW